MHSEVLTIVRLFRTAMNSVRPTVSSVESSVAVTVASIGVRCSRSPISPK